MTSELRRSSAGWVLLVVGLGGMGAGALWRSSTRPPARDLAPSAVAAHDRIDQALASAARALEPKAAAATLIPELVAALNMGADRDTFQDLLENEDWWGPLRAGYPLSGVLSATKPLALLGIAPKNLESAAPVRAALAHGSASGIVVDEGRAFALSAASVARAKDAAASPVVVVLGTVLDQIALTKVSQLTGDALGLSDGTRLVEAAGPGEPGRVLARMVGHEADAPVLLEDGRQGAAWSLGGGMWMLAAFIPAPVTAPPRNLVALALMIAGTAMALGGILALAVRGTPRSPHGPRRQSPSGSADLSGVTPSGPLPAAPRSAFPTEATPPGDRDKPRMGETSREGRPGPDQNTNSGGRTRVMSDTSPSSLALARAPGAADIGAGSQMGRYRLIERIGEGGMAEIFFAAAHGAEDFVRYFVVKRMHPHIARHREAVNHFIDEAQLQARLVHSNIVPVFDFGKAGNEYFLALEYIHGKDLGQLVAAHLDRLKRPLTVPVAFYVIYEVLEALAFAHSQLEKNGKSMQVVHRDVSPGNVLVSYRGEVKLTDFGIAKSEGRISRTEVGMVKGNVNFMSPEQARGETVDHRSDIFSAGLVLYYCLTGEPLYNESTFNRLIRAAVGPATAQFGQIGQLPPVAARILGNALNTQPDQRYATAAEFARDVAQHVASRGELVAAIDQLFPTSERRDLR